ncbi:MAG: SusC/RagA family TonB-linked outer membrane protein [Proteiniphilum sp.]
MESFSIRQVRIIATGTVVDNENNPLPGATVIEVGTKHGTVTDSEGKFSLEISVQRAEIEISFMGFQSKRVTAARGLNITLLEEVSELDEVVVIGYGTMQKRDVTGSIISVRSEDILKKTPVNIFDALQGQSPGVQIISGSGAPGEGSSIQIRGTSTFSSAGVQPLFIVDEMPVESIDDINPNDIASIEILKDAASAAIYGSRSANGVVIITTKQGEKAMPKVEVRYTGGIGRLAHKMPQANREERRLYDQIRREYFIDEGMSSSLINETHHIWRDSLNTFFNVDNDYQDMIYKTGQKHDISATVSGAENKLRYYVSNGFYHETGLIPTSSYTRINGRVNTDYFVSSKFRTGNRLSVSYQKREKVNESRLQSNIQRRAPYYNTHYADGSLVGYTGYVNPIALIELPVDLQDNYTINYYQYYDLNLTRDLRFRTNISGNLYITKQQRFSPSLITDVNQRENSGESLNYMFPNYLAEGYFTYVKKRNDHNLNGVLGVSYQRWKESREIIVGRNSSNDYIYTMNSFVANLDLSRTGTWISERALSSIYSRITYDYKSRYLVAANLRADGSSRFAKNYKWGYFPSISLGWRFSDEKIHAVCRKSTRRCQD